MTHRVEAPWTRDRPTFGESVVRRCVGGFVVSTIDFPHEGRTPSHSHECAGFTLVRQGRYTKTIGARTYECAPSMVTREPPGVTHAEVYRAATASLLVEVSPRRFAELVEIVPMLRDPAVTRDRTVVRAATRCLAEFGANDSASSLGLESGILDWIAAMARRPVGTARGHAAPHWLQRVEQRLADEWREAPSIGELAAEANVHPVYLANVFRRHFGASVSEYLRRRRVDWAATALASTDTALAEIAHGAGFFDQSHFTRVFLRYTGHRPGAYRRLHRARKAHDAT